VIPGAMPNIVTGIRMSIGFGWRALIAAEMIATSTGLGFLIYNASNFHQTDAILVGIVTIGICGFLPTGWYYSRSSDGRGALGPSLLGPVKGLACPDSYF